MPIELSLTSAEMTDDELQELARELRAALNYEGVTTELVTAPAPAYTKGGEWEAIGQLVVKGLSIGGGGAALFNVLKTYLKRKPPLTAAILAEIAQLPATARESVRTILSQQTVGASATAPQSGFIAPFDTSDSAPSLQWIAEHRAEFAGQEVALEGDRLLAHGADTQPVIAAVRASGLNGLFFTYLQPLDAPPFAGF